MMPLVELAGGQPRQLIHEVDAARALVVRDVFPRILEQFFSQRSVRGGAFSHLHHGLHCFAHLIMRHADDSHVGNFGVQDHGVFDFLRDRCSRHAGDDHEGGAVGQEQKAFVVHVAHITQSGPVRVLRMPCASFVFSSSFRYLNGISGISK